MTYWAFMLITVLSGPYEGTQTGIVYKSEDDCINAIQHVTSDLQYDFSVRCIGTDEPSGSIRPKDKPKK